MDEKSPDIKSGDFLCLCFISCCRIIRRRIIRCRIIRRWIIRCWIIWRRIVRCWSRSRSRSRSRRWSRSRSRSRRWSRSRSRSRLRFWLWIITAVVTAIVIIRLLVVIIRLLLVIVRLFLIVIVFFVSDIFSVSTLYTIMSGTCSIRYRAFCKVLRSEERRVGKECL